MDETEFQQQLVSAGVSAAQASVEATLFVEATAALRGTGPSGDVIHYWFVPGRIEFLGKHTDYAGGRSLISALERGFCVAASARADATIRITDAGRRERIEFGLSAGLRPQAGHWSNYPMTVAGRIAQNFQRPLVGADIAFISNLPSASGLSSSSALMIGIFSALARVNSLDQREEYRSNIRSSEDLAGYLGTIENGQSFGSLAGVKGVGTFGGSQDHTAILCCQPGRLSQYSFCPVRLERLIGLPDDYVFVIGVCGVSADKTGEALEKYNHVSLVAAEVLALWRTATGRSDATLMAAMNSSSDAPEQFRKILMASHSSVFSSQELLNRFEQFFIECTETIPGVAQAIEEGKLTEIGAMIDRSQQDAEALLGNQIPETIELARLARERGAVAASAFGAGFGGSVWALVKKDRAESFMTDWTERYRLRFPDSGHQSTFFLTCAGPSMLEFAD